MENLHTETEREPVIEVTDLVTHYGSRRVLDGVSLTVARLDDASQVFTVALVPHTLEQTTFADARVGQTVNIEVDILAKYVERMLNSSSSGAQQSRITEQWLRKQGY